MEVVSCRAEGCGWKWLVAGVKVVDGVVSSGGDSCGWRWSVAGVKVVDGVFTVQFQG